MIRLAYPDLEFKEVKNELRKIVDSGWLTKGPKTKEFEETICRYLNIKHAIAVSSGTAALHIALLSLGIGQKDEVIVPDFTFPATANAVELCGAKAVLVDIEMQNFNLDPLEIRKHITARTRAIMPVHQFGTPAPMDEILRIAREYNLLVIEDTACALGARYKNKMCGTIGDLGCFSFHPRKIITTAEGGAVVTNDSSLAKRLRLLREHGMSQSGVRRNFVSLGLNYRISEIASVLGIAQLKKIERIVAKRAELFKEFCNILNPLEEISVVPGLEEKGNRCVHQAFVVKINKKIDIYRLIASLRNKGIESTISNTAVHTQPYYKNKYGLKPGSLKNSLLAFKRSIALPFHNRLINKDFHRIADSLKEYLHGQ